MSDRAADVVATALAYRDSSAVVGWSHKNEAQCALDALKAAGIAVVDLPGPMAKRGNVTKRLRHLPMWAAGTSWACLHAYRLIEVEADGQEVCVELGAAEARDLAAVLLAAAAALEAYDG